MSKWRKKPMVIEATQWFQNGDHPEDKCEQIPKQGGSGWFLSEGKVVRYFRRPDSSAYEVVKEVSNGRKASG